jgi:hypothetical protein
MTGVMTAANVLFGQSPAVGALPTVFAAVAPDVAGDDYIGPRGPGGLHGHPTWVGRSAAARDPATARRLWEVSATLTGVSPTLT